MEVSLVRNRLKRAIAEARARAQSRRQQAAEAELAYDRFLQNVATPVMRMVANALKVEGHQFTVFTPGGSVRLAADRGRDDFIEVRLEIGERPEVIGRISRTRGSRTLEEERPLKPGASPEALSEEDVLVFLLDALSPWLER
jgi:hypothetical protein